MSQDWAPRQKQKHKLYSIFSGHFDIAAYWVGLRYADIFGKMSKPPSREWHLTEVHHAVAEDLETLARSPREVDL